MKSSGTRRAASRSFAGTSSAEPRSAARRRWRQAAHGVVDRAHDPDRVAVWVLDQLRLDELHHRAGHRVRGQGIELQPFLASRLLGYCGDEWLFRMCNRLPFRCGENLGVPEQGRRSIRSSEPCSWVPGPPRPSGAAIPGSPTVPRRWRCGQPGTSAACVRSRSERTGRHPQAERPSGRSRPPSGHSKAAPSRKASRSPR